MNELLFNSIVSYSQTNGCNTFSACNLVGVNYGDFLTWADKNKPSHLPLIRQLENNIPTKQQLINLGVVRGYDSMIKVTDIITTEIEKISELGSMELAERRKTTQPAKQNLQLINQICIAQLTTDSEIESMGMPNFYTQEGDEIDGLLTQ